MGNEPECAKLLVQTEISLRAIRLLLSNYRLQLLRLPSLKDTKLARELHRDVSPILPKPSITF
jgi:hypothetical protein